MDPSVTLMVNDNICTLWRAIRFDVCLGVFGDIAITSEEDMAMVLDKLESNSLCVDKVSWSNIADKKRSISFHRFQFYPW